MAGCAKSEVYKIVIGPVAELHAGAHWSLIENPPLDYQYQPRPAAHIFAFEKPDCSPFRHFHFGEYVDFGDGAEIVHSSRWPVLRRRSWIADTDDFNYPVLMGKHIFDPVFRERYEAGSDELVAKIRRRLKMMVMAYLHPSCKGLLFRSECALKDVSVTLSKFDLPRELEALSRKTAVLYPAHPPCPADQFANKWSETNRLRVVVCGRDFETKNGELTLRVMQRLRKQRVSADFSYVGDIPEGFRKSSPWLLEGIEHYENLSREQVMALFRRGHVLFHPSKFEGLGNVLVEALAAGMAVVTATSPDMAPVTEIFGSEGAFLLDRTTTPQQQEEDVFFGGLLELIATPERAARMAYRNIEESRRGKLSLAKRDQTLTGYYEAALDQDSPPLTSEDLLDGKTQILLAFGPADLEREEHRSRESLNVWDARFLL